MKDGKLLAILLGTVAGVALVTACVGVYMNNQSDSEVDVNDVFEQARKTVKKLDDAVEAIKSSAA